jgi:hypothetical protein
MRLMPLKSSVTRGIRVLTLVAVLLTGWTTLNETRRWRRAPFADFNNLQTGGECLIAGCDPYDFASLNREVAARHEAKPEIWPMTPVYPTSSLVVLLPFEGLGWPTAAYLFNALAGLATAAALVLLIWSLRIRPWDPAAIPMLASLACIPMVSAIEFANPALLVAAMIAIACVLLLQSRLRSVAWILLGLALALKPQLAIGAVAILLWRRNTRTAAAKSCALAILLLLAGVAAYRLRLGSFHFLASLRYALWLSSMPGGSSDFANKESFDFLNIQTALATIPAISRMVVNALAWLITVGLAVAALLIGRARCAVNRRPWTLIALATAISVLPIYHRGYDRVIALLLVPAAMEIAASNKRLAWFYTALLTLWIANDTIMSHILKRWLFEPQTPVEDVAFCTVLLASLWLLPRPTPDAHLVAS